MEAWSKELKRHEEVEAAKSAAVEERARRVSQGIVHPRGGRGAGPQGGAEDDGGEGGEGPGEGGAERGRGELQAVSPLITQTRIEAVCRDREAEKSKLSRVLGGLETWMDTMIVDRDGQIVLCRRGR
jgi:hypothetical protein